MAFAPLTNVVGRRRQTHLGLRGHLAAELDRRLLLNKPFCLKIGDA
jgi:hypothetical protein